MKKFLATGLMIAMTSFAGVASAEVQTADVELELDQCRSEMSTIRYYHFLIRRNEDDLRSLRASKQNLEQRVESLQATLRATSNPARRTQLSAKIREAKINLNRVSDTIAGLVRDNKNAFDWIGYIAY